MVFTILIIGIILSIAFFYIGSFFLGFRLKREAGFLENVLNFWVGIFVSISIYAIVKTSMVTILVLMLLVLIFFRKQFSFTVSQNPFPKITFGLVLAITYVLVFLIQVNFQLGVFTHPLDFLEHIHPDDGERYVYSHIVSLLYYEGVETISTEAVLHGFTGVSLYHFPEFWLASLFKTLYNAKSDLVLFYFVFPLFKTLGVLTLYSLYADKLDTFKRKILGVFIVFGFLVLGLLLISPPHAVANLRSIVIVPFLIMVAKLLYDKKYDAAFGFLLLAGIENVLFLPAAGVYLLLFFDKLEKRTMYLLGAYLVAFVLFFLLFKEKVTDKYMSLTFQEIVQTLKTDAYATRLYRIVLLALLSYPFKVLLSFLLLNNYSTLSKRAWVRDLGYWLFFCFFMYYIAFGVFENLTVDAYQFNTMGANMAGIALFFILARLIDQGKYSISLVVMLLVTDYTYPFGKINFTRTYDAMLEKKLMKAGDGKVLKGLFIDEDMPLKDKFFLYYYPSHITEYARANDYRLYLFTYDVTGLRKSMGKFDAESRRIVSKVIQPKFPLEKEIIENIRQHSISVVWISKNSKYLSEFKNYRPLHELEDYLIYSMPVGR